MIIRVSVVQRRLFEVTLTDVSSEVGPYGPQPITELDIAHGYGPYRPSSTTDISTT